MFHMEQNDRQQFESTLAVSRETVEKLDAYACLLREWNEKFNLIAPSTVEHIWTRHFMDSAQLYDLI
ncbi:MAG: class I SAM-dependent methyltransferase, partial [Alphaproteobacteria bacterium]|nr:class I SAM-dependent methyltransferase [Alphaproteobacteria bacterium]